MAKSTWIGLTVALLLLIGGGLLYFGQPPQKTPDQLIAETLQDAGHAAQRGDLGGVMDTVSDDFHAGNWNKARLRLLLHQTLSSGRGTDYGVEVHPPTILASPSGRADEREVITSFAAFYTGSGEDIYKSNQPVELIMRAETRRRLLIFSEPRWRILSVVNLPSLPGSGGSGDDIGL